jgi:hypothetical protein
MIRKRFSRHSLKWVIPYFWFFQVEVVRKVFMFRTFIDESGNNLLDPVVVAAGWVGTVEEWERFSDEWDDALIAKNPKPLCKNKGYIYFKHSEARTSGGCFAGFSTDEAEEKTRSLATLITRYDFSAVGWAVDRDEYTRVVDEVIVRKSGPMYRDYVKDPLYVLLHHLVGLVLHTQSISNPSGNVDFFFDQGKMSERVISIVSLHKR